MPPQIPVTDKPAAQESELGAGPFTEDVNKQVEGIAEPNDILDIPQEIIGKLKDKQAVQPDGLKETPAAVESIEQKAGIARTPQAETETVKKPELRPDSMLTDRMALLVKQDEGRLVFVLDALGLNAPQVSLQVLPCEALELTEQRQSIEPETVPFKIAGIMTKYKGKDYLLLQKATRVYNYGNFNR